MRKSLVGIALAFVYVGFGGPAYAIEVEGWEIKRHVGDNLDGCTMSAEFQNGTTIGIAINHGYEWGLIFSNRSWALRKGSITHAALLVDGIDIGGGKAKAIEDHSIAVSLADGTRAYRIIQQGHRMKVVVGSEASSYNLKGTSFAMSALLDCVRNSPTAERQNTPESGSDSAATPVPATEALVMVSNMLAASGLTGYRLEPPDGDLIRWSLANGVKGSFFAFRNYRGKIDDDVAVVLGSNARVCKGDFVSAKKATPTIDGTVIRKVVSLCKDQGAAVEFQNTFIQTGQNMLVISHIGVASIVVDDAPSDASVADERLSLQAAMVK